MKILLINSNRYKEPVPVMPLGIFWIAESLIEAGFETKILDLCFSNSPEKDIDNYLKKFYPDIIGISIRNIDTANGYAPKFLVSDVKYKIVEPLKKLFKGYIVIGGAAVGINGVELLEYLDLNYAIAGDGEKSMVDFANKIKNKEGVENVLGLVVRENGLIKINNSCDFSNDIDMLPVPKPWKYIDLKYYKMYNSPIQIQTKRGCSFSCIYCTYKNLEGYKYRLRNPIKIADEIENIVEHTGIRTIEFVDSTFNFPLEHAKKVLKEIISRKIKVRLQAMGLNPKFIDSELAELMKEAGFIEAGMGIESLSNITLKTLNKNFTKEEIIRAAKIMTKTKIALSWYIIAGAPLETKQTLKETFTNISKIASFFDFITIAVGIRIYKNSPISEIWKKENNNKKENFFKPIAFEPNGLDIKKIKAISRYYLAKNHNFFLFDEGANILFIARIIMKIFFPKHPIWRGYIVLRLIEKISGVFLIRIIIEKIRLKREINNC